MDPEHVFKDLGFFNGVQICEIVPKLNHVKDPYPKLLLMIQVCQKKADPQHTIIILMEYQNEMFQHEIR